MTPPILSALPRSARLAIAGTYTPTLLENLCRLAYPAITGLAVDGLLKQSYRGLAALIAVWLVHLVRTFVRQRYDTRVFMGLYARLAVHTVAEQKSRGHGTSIVSARVEMMRDIVGFFAMAVLLPMALVNACYWRRALVLHRGLNDQIEREIEDIASARILRLRRHFGRVRRWHGLATIAALVVLLIDFTGSPGFSAGAIYAVLAYV